MTPALLKSSETKDKLFKRYQKSPTVENKRSYCAYKNLSTTLRRKAEKIYLNNKLELAKNNLKETWKIIKNVINKKTNDNFFPDSFKYGDKIMKNPEEISDKFNLRTTQTFYTTSPTQRGKYLPQMKEMMYRML